jgi:hypothetical protein
VEPQAECPATKVFWGDAGADRGGARAVRYVNANLSEYLMPVSADVRRVEVVLAPERDSEVSPLGIKGLGDRHRWRERRGGERRPPRDRAPQPPTANLH